MADLGDHSEFLIIDELGIDPLRDKAIEAIQAVQLFTTYTIKSSERYNAPLIALNKYRNEKFWWHIMVYNDIDDMWEIKPGMVIKIPDMNEMVTRLTKALDVQTTSTVRI